MFPLSHTTEKIFQETLASIDQALDEGKLITSELKVVKKSGIKWAWIVFTRALLKCLSLCTHQDPWKAYRIHAFTKSLSTFIGNNQNNLTPESEKYVKEILNKLQIKTDRSTLSKTLYKNALFECKQTIEKQRETATHPKKVQEAIVNFSIKLCNKLTLSHSFALSPMNLLSLLGIMLHLVTAEHKAAFLNQIGLQGISEPDVHAALSALLSKMTMPEKYKKGTLNSAFGIAHKQDQKLSNSLTSLLQNTYVLKSNELKDEVNRKINEVTHGKIRTFIKNNDASLVLFSAVLSNLKWQQSFRKPKEGWEILPFTCLGGIETSVSMMKQKGNFRIYRENSVFDMLEKPYLSPEGRQLSQLIFLPKEGYTSTDIEELLNFAMIQFCRQQAKLEKDVTLSMPKTQVTSEFNLLKVFIEMGLPLDYLDEEMIGSNARIDIIHKTFIVNDEEGTESDSTASRLFSPIESEAFTIDRTYLFFIMDGDNALFQGRIGDKNAFYNET